MLLGSGTVPDFMYPIFSAALNSKGLPSDLCCDLFVSSLQVQDTLYVMYDKNN